MTGTAFHFATGTSNSGTIPVTGASATPVAGMVFNSKLGDATAFEWLTPNPAAGLFCAGGQVGFRQGWYAGDNQDLSETRCINVGGGGIEFTSFNSTGATFTRVASMAASGQVHGMLFGGTGAQLIEFDVTSGEQTITTTGRPDLIVFMSIPSSGGGFSLGFAATSNVIGNMVWAGGMAETRSPINTTRHCSREDCMLSLATNVASVTARSRVTAVGATSFTLTNTAAGGHGYALVIYGLSAEIRPYTTLASTTTSSTIAAANMETPTALIAISAGQAESAAGELADTARCSVGFADNANSIDTANGVYRLDNADVETDGNTHAECVYLLGTGSIVCSAHVHAWNSASVDMRTTTGQADNFVGVLLIGAAASSGVTGTGATSISGLVSAAVGGLSISGSGASSIASLVSASVGLVGVSGAGAGSFSGLVANAAGELRASGVGAGTLAPPVAAAAGALTATGVGAGDVAPLVAAAVGGLSASGAGAASVAPLAAASTGTVGTGVTGDGAASIAPLAASGAGGVGVSGVGASSVAPLVAAATGGLTASGVGAASVAPLDSAAAGSVGSDVTGSGASSLAPLATASAGGVGISGVGSAHVAALAGASAATLAAYGAGVAALGALVAAGEAVEVITSVGAAALATIACAASGSLAMSGTGAASCAPLGGASLGGLTVSGSGASTIAALASAGVALAYQNITATGASSVAGLVCTAAATVHVASIPLVPGRTLVLPPPNRTHYLPAPSRTGYQ